jgi:hypothetical protein
MLLDPKLHVTATGRRVRRQRIIDNLLGNKNYCPMIRRTDKLIAAMAQQLGQEAKGIIDGADPSLLARAVHYLFTKETKSSFAIEGEVPSVDRTLRFVAALGRADDFNTGDKQAFVELQNSIVDPHGMPKRAGARTIITLARPPQTLLRLFTSSVPSQRMSTI